MLRFSRTGVLICGILPGQKYKKRGKAIAFPRFFVPVEERFLGGLSSAETIAAIDGAIAARLKGNLAGLAAGCADGVKHLTALSTSLLTSLTAGSAALRLILEALFGVKFLFAGRENEFLTAVFADECFVVVHEIPL